jgi:hypothetical protein
MKDLSQNVRFSLKTYIQRDSNGKMTSGARYSGGNLYNLDGSSYVPDMMGHFAEKIQSTLNDIRSSDSYLEKIVSTLESADAANHYIYMGDEITVNRVTGFGNQGSTMMTLTLDALKGERNASGTKKTFGTIMAHELSHQYDRETNQHIYKPKNEGTSNDPNEIRAVNTENRYRNSKGIELRTHYGRQIDKSKLENPDKEKE